MLIHFQAWVSETKAILESLARVPGGRTERLVMFVNGARDILLAAEAHGLPICEEATEIALRQDTLSKAKSAHFAVHAARFTIVSKLYLRVLRGQAYWLSPEKEPTLLEACAILGEALHLSERTIKDSYDYIRRADPLVVVDRLTGRLSLDRSLQRWDHILPRGRGAPKRG